MQLSKFTQEELRARCAWCHRMLPEDEECYGTGATMNSAGKRLIEGREGTLTTLNTRGHELIVIVPAKGSNAQRDGYDIFFQACSEKCCANISAALGPPQESEGSEA